MTACTIVMPTHNRDECLRSAVRAALLACPPDGEVLVVDDKSAIPAADLLSVVTDARLRVVRNTGPGGAANARNFGVASAHGDVIFFADDDDEILPDYCMRVLSPGGPATQAQWGYSSILEHTPGSANERLRARKRLKRGIVKASAQPRDRVAATSDGFWIWKNSFLQAGGFDPEQSIDEDTDLCVRLLAQSRTAWYEPEPGMRAYRGYAPERPDGAQLTVATPAVKGLQCYRRTHDKNINQFATYSAMRWYLTTRYLRRAIKSQQFQQALDFARTQNTFGWSVVLTLYVQIKQRLNA